MLKLLLLIVYSLVESSHQGNPALDQTANYKQKSKGSSVIMTTRAGAPVDYRDEPTLNENLILNHLFLESTAHLNREKIPHRPVHAKGAGAFGYFITTDDVTDICKAELFGEVGKKTPVAARLSMGVTEPGGSDLTRESRGCAWKFYTKEGNFDIVGFNTPMFVAKDPYLFSPFVHSVQRNPATGFKDPNTLWDFLTLNPETFHIFLFVWGDNGIPNGYRNMGCYSIHTYQLYNKFGISNYCRFHIIPEGGPKSLNSSEASRIGALDPDYSAKDLYNAIGGGNFPSWQVYLQCLTEEAVKNATFDVFDISKTIPTDLYPLRRAGRIVLNRNPRNYFAEVEQLAFCPSNVVPGILGSPDKAYEARCFAYKDAQRYRLGANFDNIPVNCPYRSQVYTYDRDGVPPVDENGKDAPRYHPNSFDNVKDYKEKNRPRRKVIHEAAADNIEQARDYTEKMTSDERSRFVENVVATLCYVQKEIQDRAVKIFYSIHSDLGDRVSQALKIRKC